MLYRMFAFNLNASDKTVIEKKTQRVPLSFAEDKAPFRPTKSQKKALKKLNEIFNFE